MFMTTFRPMQSEQGIMETLVQKAVLLLNSFGLDHE